MPEKRGRGRPFGSKSKPRVIDSNRVVQAGCVYPLAVFQAMTRMSHTSIRFAEQQGLRVVRRFNRTWIVGDDFLRWMKSDEMQEPPKASSGS
jgi:hypothetical protein